MKTTKTAQASKPATKTVKTAKTVRQSTLNKKQLHAIYKPAAQIAWVSIFAKRAKSAKTPADRKEYLAKMKAQIASLPTSARARFKELESERAA